MANTQWSTTDKSAGMVLSGGNLVATGGGATPWVRAVDKQIAGKFYWEVTATTWTNNASATGISAPTANLTGSFGSTATAVGSCGISRAGNLIVDGTTVVSGFGIIASATVICFAFDAGTRQIWVRLGAAGNWNNNVANNPATGVGGVNTWLAVGIPAIPAFFAGTTSDAATANFGDSTFVGAVPSGYTSGFTAGASVPTNAIASQALAEHWLTTDPQAQTTLVVAEHWQSVASTSLQAVVTFVAVEHWMSVASVVPAAGGPQVTMIH